MKIQWATLLMSSVLLTACSKTDRQTEGKLAEHRVQGLQSHVDLLFKLPKTYQGVERRLELGKNVPDFLIREQLRQGEYGRTVFYDTLDPLSVVWVMSAERINVSREEPRRTYFTVPTFDPDLLFPRSSDSLKLIYEWLNIKYKGKIYTKRKYEVLHSDSTRWLSVFLVNTKEQSALIVMNSFKDIRMDTVLLDFKVVSRPPEP